MNHYHPSYFHGKKGQFIVISFVLFFASVVGVTALLGPLVQTINSVEGNITANPNGQIVQTLINLTPLFIVLMLVTSLFLILANR